MFNRPIPFRLLSLIFVVEVLGAGRAEWSFLANALATLGGLVVLFGAYALFNRARGQSALAVPERVGYTELAAFVLLPALLPLVFGGDWADALKTAGLNVAILVLIYLVVGWGLLYILGWVFSRLLSQLAGSLGLLTRAVPLLLIFSLVLFLTVEMWEVFSSIPAADLALVGALFVGVGTVFLVARLPREVRSLERETSESQAPLSRRQRFNVGLVMFISQAMQILFVALVVGLFFVAFGLLAIGEEVRREWIGGSENVLFTIDLPGHTADLSEELLRVAGGIAAFTGLYFAIAVLTDSTYREEFLDELTGEMRKSFRSRAAYLRARG